MAWAWNKVSQVTPTRSWLVSIQESSWFEKVPKYLEADETKIYDIVLTYANTFNFLISGRNSWLNLFVVWCNLPVDI